MYKSTNQLHWDHVMHFVTHPLQMMTKNKTGERARKERNGKGKGESGKDKKMRPLGPSYIRSCD